MALRTSIAELVRRSRGLGRDLGALNDLLPGLDLPSTEPSRLTETADFGANPGALRMFSFAPANLPANAPLVVVLHGCTQTAAGYDRGAGWSALAEQAGFAVLAPEQRQTNNPNRCFNWFDPADTARGAGEVASIRQMIEHLVVARGLDRRRIFVTGLSAGGAMTSALLAAYPEVFAAGAIIAGLPHGAAATMSEAFEAMATGRPRPAEAWAAAVRDASAHAGPWPRVAVWQGGADTTVRPVNAEEILKQWRALHGVAGAPLAVPGQTPAHRHHQWRGRDGAVVLEHHAIAGMAHGVPIGRGQGVPGPFILDVGVASTPTIAAFFGLVAEAAIPAATAPTSRVFDVAPDGATHPAEAPAAAPEPPKHEPETGPGAVIRRALVAAGLMKG